MVKKMDGLKDNKKEVIGKRLIGLDIFRIMSAFLVFLFHSVVHLKCTYGVFSGFISMGAIFMTGFFILSGFTLFTSWENKGLSDLSVIRTFYIRRFINIYPLYLFVTFFWILFWGGKKDYFFLLPIEILGIQSTFVSLFDYWHNSGTWFISCLLVCYVLYPFGQECIKQLSFKGKMFLLVLSFGVLLWAPIVAVKFQTARIYDNPFYRCLEFLIGVILAAIYKNINKEKFRFFFTFRAFFVELCILIIGVSILFNNNFYVNDYMLYNWIALPMFICMILSLAGVSVAGMKGHLIIRYFSAISYCFFLVQFWVWPITNAILRYINLENNILKIIISFSICIFLSVLLHELFEKPITRWLKKFLGHL